MKELANTILGDPGVLTGRSFFRPYFNLICTREPKKVGKTFRRMSEKKMFQDAAKNERTQHSCKGGSKRGHIVAHNCNHAAQTGKHCGLKMFLKEIRNIFVSRTQILCLQNCCTRGQTGKHFCLQQCVRNFVSSFVTTLSE